ncbi:hypothetical protein EON80_08590 [bacterium]|nr:MAG: hypothetical protein EON80_08590 [bacterium]
MIDPRDTTGKTRVETLDLVFFPDSNGSIANKESRWDLPITVQVVGVDDDSLDGNQSVTILTSTAENTANTLTTDPAYQTIDPIDPIVTNEDNEANGITVSPTNLVIDEGSTDTFTVKINTAPVFPVNITLTNLNPAVATATVQGGANGNRITFTPENWRVAQTVIVRGVADNAFTPQRTAVIQLSNAVSSDPKFNNLDVADVNVSVQNQTQAFLVEPASVVTTGITTSEDGGTATFTVRLPNAPTGGDVRLTLSTSSGEVNLSSGSERGSSINLNFTAANFGTLQTVTVIGLDDAGADGNVAYNINGTITTADATYAGQVFPSIPGVNLDNDGVSSGGGITFAANGTYTVSFPYATTAAADGTLTQAQAFSKVTGSGTPAFTLYKFNPSVQRNSRALNGGSDFTVVPAGEKLVRGVGYRLVTGDDDIVLNQPSNTLKAFAGTTYTYNLTWNNNFLADTSSTDNRNNGYNFIGFPFDPTNYNRVAFPSSLVKYGNETYQTVSDAAAAGIIDQRLYTVDAQGNLTPASTDLNIRPYRAYFVRILRNDKAVSITLRNPSK